MTADPVWLSHPLRELRYALAEGDAMTPPAELRALVVTGAMRDRAPGLPVDAPAGITAVEALRRTVSSLDGVLSGLTTAEWARPALRDLDVRGVVGHLIGVEHDFQAGLAGGDGASVAGDHIGSTQAAATAQAGRAGHQTHRDWLVATTRTLDALESLDEEALASPLGLHRVTLPLERWLVVRAFEMWTHEEDIRRALGRPLMAPEPARLSLMTGLAVTLLPAGMARVDRAIAGRSARLVLTGPGGGTWTVPHGVDGGPRPEARLVMDAATFCRVVADRDDPAQVPVAVSGDRRLADDLLVGATALAFD